MKPLRTIWRLIPLLVILLLFQSSLALAKEGKHKRDWCSRNKGIINHILDDGSLVDCLTEDYAIEFDLAKNWANAVGKALYYSIKTGKKPGVVLIIKKKKDYEHLKKLLKVSENHDIKVWTMPQIIFVE
jgi:hypothetical protein